MAARASGHLQVRGPSGARVFYALWRGRAGVRHRLRLGPAHIRDSGRRTERGAVIWRAGHGPKPEPGFLTPADADDQLQALLADEQFGSEASPMGQTSPPTLPSSASSTNARTFGEACEEWLNYVEHERQRARSTVRDYRNTVRRHLIGAFGADTPLEQIDTETIDALRQRLLSEGLVSRRTAQKILVLLHGILKRAKRKGWISSNPAEDAERVTFKRSGDFNVLAPVEVEAVARAARSEQDGAIFAVAAFTGLRMGELRALRWSDLDFARRVIHVRRSFSHGQFGPPKSQRVRSVPLTDQAAVRFDGLSRRERWTRPDDLIFVNDVGGPFDDVRLRRRFYIALEAAGLGRLRQKPDPIIFHDLRHTFGTLAVQAFALSDVKAMLGHERIETTMIYVHHMPQNDAADRLSALLGGGEMAVGRAGESRTAQGVPLPPSS